MLSDSLLDNSIGWLIFLVATSLMLIGNYYGYRLGLWHQKRNPEIAKGSNTEIMGAIFSVLGFTLAFLFGMSLTRLENKKEIVMAEATAVLNAYQHAQFLPEPQKSIAGRMLIDYGTLRYQLATNAREVSDIKALREGILQCERIQDSLLRKAMEIRNVPGADAAAFTQSVSTIIELNLRRIQNSSGDRIPRSLKILMYVMALLGLAGMGYGSGLKGGRSLIPNIILVIVFAVIIGIIVDMDHPANALFKISQEPMKEVIRRMISMKL